MCLFEVSRAQAGVFGSEIENKTEIPAASDDKLDPILENPEEKQENDADEEEDNEDQEGYADEDDAQVT